MGDEIIISHLHINMGDTTFLRLIVRDKRQVDETNTITHNEAARCKNPKTVAPRYPPAPNTAIFFLSNGLAAQPFGLFVI
mmetsp:Transcript_18098/g.37509  ORF Transcript_18098/g.37509 Transcript_18098/m.37509 type:complete len:80 (+) Transcript_18098:866-1105(+)